MKRVAVALTVCCVVFLVATTLQAAKPIKEYFAGEFLGFFIGDCGTFNVLSDGSFDGHYKLWLDEDGNFIRAQQRYNYDGVYYADTNPDEYIRGGPGEGENDHIDFIDETVAVSGTWIKVRIPGYGVIFHEGGRLVIDLVTGEVLFQAGPSDFRDENLAAICAALTP